MTDLVRKTYTPAIKGKQRYFLREGKKKALLLPSFGGGLIGTAIVTFTSSQAIEAPLLGVLTGIAGVTVCAFGIVFGVKTNKAVKKEYPRLVEIMTDFYGDQITAGTLYTACNLLWSGKQDGVWINPDDTSVNRISYNEETDEIAIASKPLTQEQFRKLRILKELDEKEPPSSSRYVHEAITSLSNKNGEPVLTSKQKLTLPANPTQADDLTVDSYNTWLKAMKKNTPAQLHPVITEIKSLLTAATTTPVNQEDEHTLQRILRDSTEASNYYQNVVAVTSALPDSDELQAEASGTLNRILHALKSEAQAIATTQAQSAMTKLKVHESYVNPEHELHAQKMS